jgi:hypothetical protein
MGRISGRQWGIPLAAHGENYMTALTEDGSYPSGTLRVTKVGEVACLICPQLHQI